MAKCIGPLHSSEARGRMGGLVFNTWRGLNVVKQSTSPANPRSPVQLKIRGISVGLTRSWQAETAANQATWNAYAATHVETDGMGSPKRLSGMNWYLRLNSRLIYIGQPKAVAAPVVPGPATPAGYNAANGVGSSVVTWTSPGGTAHQMQIYYQGPHSTGRLGKIEMAKYWAVVTAESATATVTPLGVGRYTIFSRFVLEANGLASPWVSDTADIT